MPAMEYDPSRLLALSGRRGVAVKHSKMIDPAIEEGILTEQVLRDLGKIAHRAAGLPENVRDGLAEYVARKLGVAA